MNEGVKYDLKKRRFSLLPTSALLAIVDVLEHGAQKYAPDNWKRVEGGSQRYGDALLRHFYAWRQGETLDQDSGLHHLAHVACNAIFLLVLDQEKEDK